MQRYTLFQLNPNLLKKKFRFKMDFNRYSHNTLYKLIFYLIIYIRAQAVYKDTTDTDITVTKPRNTSTVYISWYPTFTDIKRYHMQSASLPSPTLLYIRQAKVSPMVRSITFLIRILRCASRASSELIAIYFERPLAIKTNTA